MGNYLKMIEYRLDKSRSQDADLKTDLKYIHETYGDEVFLSLVDYWLSVQFEGDDIIDGALSNWGNVVDYLPTILETGSYIKPPEGIKELHKEIISLHKPWWCISQSSAVRFFIIEAVKQWSFVKEHVITHIIKTDDAPLAQHLKTEYYTYLSALGQSVGSIDEYIHWINKYDDIIGTSILNEREVADYRVIEWLLSRSTIKALSGSGFKIDKIAQYVCENGDFSTCKKLVEAGVLTYVDLFNNTKDSYFKQHLLNPNLYKRYILHNMSIIMEDADISRERKWSLLLLNDDRAHFYENLHSYIDNSAANYYLFRDVFLSNAFEALLALRYGMEPKSYNDPVVLEFVNKIMKYWSTGQVAHAMVRLASRCDDRPTGDNTDPVVIKNLTALRDTALKHDDIELYYALEYYISNHKTK